MRSTSANAVKTQPSLRHLGKPMFTTDETGAVVCWDAGTATPFGDGVQLASAFTQSLQFPGQYYDEETTLSHNHHRTYDPALGRYLQSDPIGLAGGINRHAYVGGNPIVVVDPLGLKAKIIVDENGAGGRGHTYGVFQNSAGNCHRYDQSANGANSVLLLLASPQPVGAKLSPVPCDQPLGPNEIGVEYDSTPEEGARLYQCAQDSVDRHQSNQSKYNLYTNNCTDAVIGIFNCAGIKGTPTTYTPTPNNWIKKFRRKIPPK